MTTPTTPPIGELPAGPAGELLRILGDRSIRGVTRVAKAVALITEHPTATSVLRTQEPPVAALGGTVAEIAVAVFNGVVGPPGGWDSTETKTVSGLLAELWGEGRLEDLAFAAHRILILARSRRDDLEVLEKIIAAAGITLPSRRVRWPDGHLLGVLDSSLRAPLPDLTSSNVDGRLAVVAGWISLGGGGRLLRWLFESRDPVHRDIAVCCYALFSDNTSVSADGIGDGRRELLSRITSGDLAGGLQVAYRLVGLPPT